VFLSSPNQPIRYSIRSSGTTGSFRYICSQVATEGSINECGYNIAVATPITASVPSNTVATIGTTYPLKSVRKKTTHRDISIKVTGAQVFVGSNTDILHWSIQLNPTLSSPLTYTDVANSSIQEADGSTTAATISKTVTIPGKVIARGIVTQGTLMPQNLFETDFLSYLGCSLTNVMDELVLCVTPITATITLNGVISLKEY